MLQELKIYLGTKIATDEQSLDMLEAILGSWDADVSQQDVFLFPFFQEDFTRQAYADLLRKMGQVLEGWLQSPLVPSGADGEASDQRTKRGVWVVLYDRESLKDWWRRHIVECFPTFAKSSQLCMRYLPCECSRTLVLKYISHLTDRTLLAYHSKYKWKDSDALPPVIAAAG